MSGGLARRSVILKTVREEQASLLLVDTGGFLAGSGRDLEFRSDINLKGMTRLAYDAVNLGASDFYFGPDYLKDMASDLSIPFVSTNLVPTDENEPWFKNYLIRETDGIKIGILGVTSPESFEALPNRNEIAGLRAVPPDSVLKEAVPQLREKVDVVLLLSHLTPEETEGLIDDMSGIDIAIVVCPDGDDCETADNENPGDAEKTPHLKCARPLGLSLDGLEIQTSSDKTISILGDKHIELGDSVPHDPEIDDLITDAYIQRKLEENRAKREAELQLHQELMKGLEMTPEEFFKLQRENPSTEPGTVPNQED